MTPDISTAPARRRVGVDFHVWDGIFQGSRSHLLGLYKEAVRLAPDLDFVFFLDDVDSLREAHPAFALPNVELVHMPHRPAIWRLSAQLWLLRRRHRIDLLHMQYRLPLFPGGACACTIHDILYETHPQFFSRRFIVQSRMTGRKAARDSAVLMAVSEFSKAELVRLYGVAPDRIQVTYNGVDRERFHPAPGGEQAVAALGLTPGRYILTVGRLEPRKNHAALVAAYARLGPQAPPLVIVGQRDFSYEQIFDAIQTHGLGDRVRLLEAVDDDALPALMRHASVFAYPAFAEGFGMPVAEAMASGVPVVTSNTTSLPEVGGPATIAVSPDSVEELAAGLRSVLDDPARADRMTRAGLEQVRRFEWTQSAAVLVAAFRKALKG